MSQEIRKMMISSDAKAQLEGFALGVVLRENANADDVVQRVKGYIGTHSFKRGGVKAVELLGLESSFWAGYVDLEKFEGGLSNEDLVLGAAVSDGVLTAIAHRDSVLHVQPGLLRPKSVHALVFTADAFLSRGHFDVDDQIRCQADNYTHVLTEFLATPFGFEGATPRSSQSWVRQLALMDPHSDDTSKHLIRSVSEQTVAFEKRWLLVG